MAQIITSKENNKIKELVKLRKSKVREEKGEFLIEGYHSIEMAYKANLLKEIYSLKEEPNFLDVTQYIITKDILDKISSCVTSQGIVGKCKTITSQPITNNKIIYLDNISDPGNMGTILRTALAFGYKDVIISHDSVSIYNEKVLSATQGAIFSLNIIDGNIDTLKELKNNGYKIIATSLKNSIDINKLENYEKEVLVFGNEGAGVKNEILNISDYNVIIPIDNIDSLNVGVAAGIAMFIRKN